MEFLLGAKLALSNLFSKPTNEDKENTEYEQRVSHSVKISPHNIGDQVDEHIYEELDSLYADASAQTTTPPPLTPNSFFGARISRAEILDYLNNARGRLAKTENTVGDKTNGQDCDNERDEDGNEDNQDLCELMSPIVTTIHSSTDLADLNNDSGNSSFVDAIDYSDTFIPGIGKSRIRKARARNISADQSLNLSVNNQSSSMPISASTVVNRRNRVSNVSNSSSDSSATSGVSGISSNLSDEVEEDDMITNSSSSLGSMANENGSSGSASCYYGTCGSLGSGGLVSVNSPSTVLERNDSGVGADIATPKCLSLSKSKSASTPDVPSTSDLHGSCIDCDLETLFPSDTNLYHHLYHHHSPLCQRCEKRRNERKEIISEIVDTELKYGRDLKIIQEEFAHPISVAGLLTSQQVDDIFLNLDELIEVNEHFAEQLQDALECAIEQKDEVCPSQFDDIALLTIPFSLPGLYHS